MRSQPKSPDYRYIFDLILNKLRDIKCEGEKCTGWVPYDSVINPIMDCESVGGTVEATFDIHVLACTYNKTSVYSIEDDIVRCIFYSFVGGILMSGLVQACL
ncbi:Hypothetical protein POVR1_LOCUS77 [uncultured virus]|nr:Hypothetical protein POVR1_LOCUS77 [uncultured virus]